MASANDSVNVFLQQPELMYLAEHDAIDGGVFCGLCLGGKCGSWEDIYGWEVDFPHEVPKPPFVPPA